MYDRKAVESKWQRVWEEQSLFRSTPDARPPKYILDMFPYPSGQGLHVGHPEGYIATDILSRFYRAKGFNVLHPMGWDAFGLPAENYAIKHGVHPRVTTEKNIDNYRRQIKSFGFSYDWDREINTCDEHYYRWTQWIFIQLFNSYFDPVRQQARPIAELSVPAELTGVDRQTYINNQRLAYEAQMPINWCPSCKTGLANEEVKEGRCDRCHNVVERKMLRQWVLRITKYADRLLQDLEALDWAESIKMMQRAWIGQSQGAEIEFKLAAGKGSIKVFTTRPDTLFGVCCLVVAPESSLVDELVTAECRAAVMEYREVCKRKSDLERTELNKDKTGVFTGGYALCPFTGRQLPIWIGDYVLPNYGTGAIMVVPAHDQRDYEFARKYNLPIVEVVSGGDISTSAYEDIEDGTMINSDFLNGLTARAAIGAMIEALEQRGVGQRQIQYKLRDWIFARQRYWGEPIPLVHCAACGVVALPESALPLTLPEVERYEPTGTGESPLAAIPSFVETTCPECGGPARRETNTMPQWAGSCWYYLAYTLVQPGQQYPEWSRSNIDYYLGERGVDIYVGGAEHAVLHLLYARFWHKVLYDLGYVSTKEPFYKLRNQGMILGEDGEKMSKSRGNVINPDAVIEAYGADVFRLYEMFMGPFDQVKPWSTSGIDGLARFMQKVWRVHEEGLVREDSPLVVTKMVHKTLRKVGEDIERFAFNTAISQMMMLINLIHKEGTIGLPEWRLFILTLAPFAPHLTEELWSLVAAGTGSVTEQAWPQYDLSMAEDDEVEIVIQVNGKLRHKLTVAVDTPPVQIIEQAKAAPELAAWLTGKQVLKEVVVPGKLVNFVVQ